MKIREIRFPSKMTVPGLSGLHATLVSSARFLERMELADLGGYPSVAVTPRNKPSVLFPVSSLTLVVAEPEDDAPAPKPKRRRSAKKKAAKAAESE